MLGTVCLFEVSFANIVTITFSALVIIELYNIHSTLSKVNWLILGALCFSIMIYIIIIATLPATFDRGYITWPMVLKVIIITSISFIPFYVWQKI